LAPLPFGVRTSGEAAQTAGALPSHTKPGQKARGEQWPPELPWDSAALTQGCFSSIGEELQCFLLTASSFLPSPTATC